VTGIGYSGLRKKDITIDENLKKKEKLSVH